MEGNLEKGKQLQWSGRLISTHSSLSIYCNVVGVLITPPFKKPQESFCNPENTAPCGTALEPPAHPGGVVGTASRSLLIQSPNVGVCCPHLVSGAAMTDPLEAGTAGHACHRQGEAGQEPQGPPTRERLNDK